MVWGKREKITFEAKIKFNGVVYKTKCVGNEWILTASPLQNDASTSQLLPRKRENCFQNFYWFAWFLMYFHGKNNFSKISCMKNYLGLITRSHLIFILSFIFVWNFAATIINYSFFVWYSFNFKRAIKWGNS